MSIFDDERDDFWDIEKLVPKKKNALGGFSSSPKSHEHKIDGEKSDITRLKLTSLPMENKIESEEKSYIPTRNSLIKRVKIIKSADKYDFYGNFRKAALIYYDFKTQRCDFAKYYSYMPQYSQLTSEQKNYYFYWRSEVRQGRYIKSDYSYLYLYVYEILNLPDKVVPAEGILLLCKLWREYRKSLPKIDSLFAVWVRDYCLVHDLELPIELLRDFIYEVISVTDFPEFYLSDFETAGVFGTETMLLYLSDYDWRRGKFAGGENAEIYREHMIASMSYLFTQIFAHGVYLKDDKTTVTVRSAFPHSLCTHAVKCRLEIEYIPLSKDDLLRARVTEAVRYAENKLRALFGIKSRLSIKALPTEYKEYIDAYFEPIIDCAKIKVKKTELPEYEKLYDAPREELSFDGADRLELASWSITARLVSDEDTDEENEEEVLVTASGADIADGTTGDEENYGLSASDIFALHSISEYGTVDDSLAERINEAFADGFGDVILEYDGEKYIIIEDYREEITEWLTKRAK